MKLIIVSGPPASGKTTIAQQLAAELGFEYIGKDQIKEKIFDEHTYTSRGHWWYEKKAKELFFEKISSRIQSSKSIIIESNFIKKDGQKLQTYLSGNVQLVEVFCYAKGLSRFARYVKRNESRERHAGHHDRYWYLLMFANSLISYLGIWWPYGPLNLTDKKLSVDATDFNEINYQKIIEFINNS